MQVVELFSGWQPLSNEFMRRGHNAVTVDDGSIEGLDVEEAGTDIVADILELKPEDLPSDVDVVWASPPCTCFSRASMGHHWYRPGVPATEKCERHVRLVKRTIRLIHDLEPEYWFVENPVGMMRYVLHPLEPEIISYCRYGHDDMKPTYLFGEHPPSLEYRTCREGNNECHNRAPRSSNHAGTQGRGKNAAERSKLPPGLCGAVVDACEEPFAGVPQQQDLAEVVE